MNNEKIDGKQCEGKINDFSILLVKIKVDFFPLYMIKGKVLRDKK